MEIISAQANSRYGRAVINLHNAIKSGENAEELLWQIIIAFQNHPFYTSSGLPFTYTVKRKRSGEYSGELIVSRKEGSKTLTRSSVMLAFRKVQQEIKVENAKAPEENPEKILIPPFYKGPKAIGQIFGISYVYSLFWKLGLITVPEKIEEKLKGKEI